MTTAGFPHSETLGSQPGCRLPEDYRRLQRPSSAPGTKTSTVCPYKLDTRHYMQFLQKTEDARVHYAVLKIRTEPCLRAPHPGGPSAGRSSQRPSKAAASSGPNSVLSQRVRSRARSARRRGGGVLAARSRASWMNSQCSTRKHGRPVTHSVTRGAGAP